MLKKSYIQVYTGEGKGKTTAAIGLALRMAGAGGRVLILQFVKKRRCSEHIALALFHPTIEIRQCGKGFIRKKNATERDRECAQRCLNELKKVVSLGTYDMIVLDEVNIAFHHQLIDIKEFLDTIAARNKKTEIVITGRHAPDAIIAAADLVTEMRNIKHYYQKGVKSRIGIEK